MDLTEKEFAHVLFEVVGTLTALIGLTLLLCDVSCVRYMYNTTTTKFARSWFRGKIKHRLRLDWTFIPGLEVLCIFFKCWFCTAFWNIVAWNVGGS